MIEIAKNMTAAAFAEAIKKPTRVELCRTYRPGVTTGKWKGYIDGKLVVETKTIELKWANNQPRVSCILEGIFDLEPSEWHSHHDKPVLEIKNVPDRDRILVHPANYASGKHVELLGCIAPVTAYSDLDGDGIIDGTNSQKAFNKIMKHFKNIKCQIIIYS